MENETSGKFVVDFSKLPANFFEKPNRQTHRVTYEYDATGKLKAPSENNTTGSFIVDFQNFRRTSSESQPVKDIM